jgi:hypothetical protein
MVDSNKSYYNTDKVALVLTCHPRIEYDFIEEFIEYYLLLGVNKIIVYIDNRDSIEDNFFDPKNPNSDKFVWSKKPNFNYRLEQDNKTILTKFQEKLKKYKNRVEYKYTTNHGNRIGELQTDNVLDAINNLTKGYMWLCHFDTDEFIVSRSKERLTKMIDIINLCVEKSGFNKNIHYSISVEQVIMNRRWKRQGVNHYSVFDITETKGEYAENNDFSPKWKSIFYIPLLKYRISEIKDKILDRPSMFVHGRELPPYTFVDRNIAALFHFCGWSDIRHAEQDQKWSKYMTFNTDEHVKYREIVMQKEKGISL